VLGPPTREPANKHVAVVGPLTEHAHMTDMTGPSAGLPAALAEWTDFDVAASRWAVRSESSPPPTRSRE